MVWGWRRSAILFVGMRAASQEEVPTALGHIQCRDSNIVLQTSPSCESAQFVKTMIADMCLVLASGGANGLAL